MSLAGTSPERGSGSLCLCALSLAVVQFRARATGVRSRLRSIDSYEGAKKSEKHYVKNGLAGGAQQARTMLI